jgi:hypothetical protein
MNRISQKIILLAIAALTFSAMFADRVVTTRKNLKVNVATSANLSPADATADSLIAPTNAVRFCGYEKTLSATRETIFIENLTDSIIQQIAFTINYLDSSNRQIHSRKVKRDIKIPAQQTRRLDIPSWDTQKSYYYIHGKRPRKSATPYNISISADTLIINAK